MIERANVIIAEYEAQGFTMTLRQLYSRAKRLGSILSSARDSGLIDWDSIGDRTRGLVTHSSWDSPEEIISAVASQYREDVWRDRVWYAAEPDRDRPDPRRDQSHDRCGEVAEA